MDEKPKDDSKKVMLVEDAKDGSIKAVSGVDKEGNLKTSEPNQKGLDSLLDVNTGDSGLEAFFKKFMEQAKEPAHSGIYILGKDTLDRILSSGKNFLDEINIFRADPAEELHDLQQKKQDNGQAFEPMDVSKIDLKDLEKKGIRMEDLEPHLKAMSYGHKSNQLVDMNPEMEPGGMRVPTKGRVSLEEMADGSLRVIPHFRQDKPNLDAPLLGTMLDDKVKENLLKTGHAGELVNLETTPGKKEPCFVTLDPLTNKTEVLPAREMGTFSKIKGVELSQGQQLDLAAGRKVLVERMTSRAGLLFDGYIQVNASDKKLDFTYEGLDRKRYAGENKEIMRQRKTEGKDGQQQRQSPAGDTPRQSFIRKKLGGGEVPDDVYNKWKAAEKDPGLQKDVRATYVKNIKKDEKGQPVHLWVKPNYEKDKLEFFKWNPDKTKKQATEVTPTNESKTQVAVNNEGKTDEATKNVKEPLKKGQVKPDGNQQKQEDTQKKAIQPKKPTQKKGGPKL